MVALWLMEQCNDRGSSNLLAIELVSVVILVLHYE